MGDFIIQEKEKSLCWSCNFTQACYNLNFVFKESKWHVKRSVYKKLCERNYAANMQAIYVASQSTHTWKLNVYLISLLFPISNSLVKLLQTLLYNLLFKSTLLMNSI